MSIETTSPVALPPGPAQRSVGVVPFVRLVPTGVVSGGSGRPRALRATALLTPEPIAGDALIHLSHWPSDVLGLLGGANWTLKLQLREVKIAEGAVCGPEFETGETLVLPARVIRLPEAFDGPDGPKRVEDLQTLWTSTFIRGGTTWEHLQTSLEHSMAGNGFQAGSDLTGTGNRAEPLPEIDKDGSIAIDSDLGKGRHVDGIYTQAHTELALALEYGRARRVADAIKQKLDAAFSDVEEDNFAANRKDLEENEIIEKFKNTNKGNIDDITVDKRKTNRERNFAALGQNFDQGRKFFLAKCNSDLNAHVNLCSMLADQAIASKSAKEIFGAPAEPLVNGSAAHAYSTPQLRKWEDKSDPKVALSGQRFFAIQSTAALARLYCVAIDLEISLSDEQYDVLKNWQFAYATVRDQDGIALGSKSENCPPWSLVRIAGLEEKAIAFWPETREAMMAFYLGCVAADYSAQADGYVVAGEMWGKGGEARPRFDLTSLNVRAATEAQLPNTIDALPVQVMGQANAFQTGGLAILDRGTQREKAEKLARRDTKIKKQNGGAFWCENDVLYADDLTIGYRLDVGVPHPTDGTTRWRPMHLRLVDYGTSGDRVAREIADELMPLMAGRRAETQRVAMDAGMVTSPEQLLPKGAVGGNDPIHVDLAVAENIVTWTGSPLGLEAMTAPLNYGGTPSGQRSAAGDVLPFGRVVSLPDGRAPDDKNPRPPPLRLAWPYRFAMRAVYSGGMSVDYESISLLVSDSKKSLLSDPDNEQSTLDEWHGNRLGFPVLPTGPRTVGPAYFRFLRQKTIDAPAVLLPRSAALSANGEYGEYGFQENQRVVLRTLGRPDRGAQVGASPGWGPSTTSRIILPPAMAMEEVASHGVLDDQDGDAQGAYARMRYERVRNGSGFPQVKYTAVEGFNGAWLPFTERLVVKPPEVPEKKSSATINLAGRTARVRDFYQSSLFARWDGANTSYFPDPFAQTLVLSARFAETRQRLPGANICVDVYTSEPKPGTRSGDPRNALVVLVVFDAVHDCPAKIPSTESLFLGRRYVKLDDDGRALPGAAVEAEADAIEIRVGLPAGLQLLFDAWFVPSVPVLTSMSAVVQALAVIPELIAPEQNGGGSGGIEDLYGPEFLAAYDVPPPPSSQKKLNVRLAAPGCLEVPPLEQLTRYAQGLRSSLVQRPNSDIASIATLTCTHATDHVPDTIRIVRPEDGDALKLHRAEHKDYVAHVAACKAAGTKVGTLIVDNEKDFVLAGEIEIDLRRLSGFDVLAEMETPTSGSFDDPKRRRDLRSVRTGTWPLRVADADDGSARRPKTTRELFGFEVRPSGTASLPRGQVKLFSVRNMPASLLRDAGSAGADADSDYARLRLEDLLYRTKDAADGFGDASVIRSHDFSDCKGRTLKIWIHPVPRCLPLLSTVDRLDEKNVQVVGVPFSAERIVGDSEVVAVALPSSTRPKQPGATGPLYCFDWREEDRPRCPSIKPDDDGQWKTVVRKPVIRLMFDRPWFSSDAAEKLGIVLWPPHQRDQKYLGFRAYPEQTQNRGEPSIAIDEFVNRVVYRRNAADAEPEEIELPDFVDEDLGPGGKFVTRLGGDPLKSDLPTPKIFLPYTAFAADPFARGENGKSDPHKLDEDAWMPVSRPSDEDESPSVNRPTEETETPDGTLEFLTVALLLYEPRFDPDAERWFVDVELNNHSIFTEPFIRLGTVRYTAQGRKDLQVSQPAVTWAKVLPERSVDAAYDEQSGRVRAYVYGPATGGMVGPKLQKFDSHPQIYGVLVRESSTSDHLATRVQIKSNRPAATTQSGLVLPIVDDRDMQAWFVFEIEQEQASNKLMWSFETQLAEGDRPAPGETLILYLEEVERFRPATYPSEPVDHAIFSKPAGDAARRDPRDIVVESGPRFSSRIVLVDGNGAGQPGAKGPSGRK